MAPALCARHHTALELFEETSQRSPSISSCTFHCDYHNTSINMSFLAKLVHAELSIQHLHSCKHSMFPPARRQKVERTCLMQPYIDLLGPLLEDLAFSYMYIDVCEPDITVRFIQTQRASALEKYPELKVSLQ